MYVKHKTFPVVLKFLVPIKQLLEYYQTRGFLQVAKKGKNQNRYVARRVDKLLMLECDTNVVKQFNIIMRKLNDYYCGSRHRSTLCKVFRLLKISCALTLANRHKLPRASQAFVR